MTTTVTRDFSFETRRALARRGIRLLGSTAIPAADGPGPLRWANAERGYEVDDNGTHRVWTRGEVLEAAR